MKRLIPIILLCCASIFSFAQQPTLQQSNPNTVTVKYLEEIELVSIVAHLAGIDGYVWDNVVTDYIDEIDQAFQPFVSHPAVKFARKKLYSKGFNWHFPVTVALKFHLVDGTIQPDEELVADFDNYYLNISRKNEAKFMELLQNFYDDTNFHQFYMDHETLYSECEAAMQEIANLLEMGWYDTFFGPKNNVEQHIYLGILTGPANYAVHQMKKDGTEIVNAVMGCCKRNSEGKVFYGIHYTLPIIIHEFNHSYCNPLDDEVWDQIKDKATEIFATDPAFYKSIAYGAPLFVMNETFVEACMIRYLMSHEINLGRFTVEDFINADESGKKFLLIRPVIEALEERETNPDLYPTMREFLPRYVEVINNYELN